MNQSEQKFSAEEWETCLKVLNALKEDPFLNPDNRTFSGLITKIHKNAKKQSRHENYSEMKSHDLAVNSNAVLMQKALAGVSAFYDDEKEERIKITRVHSKYIVDLRVKTLRNQVKLVNTIKRCIDGNPHV